MKQAILLLLLSISVVFSNAQLTTTNQTRQRTGIDSLASTKAITAEEKSAIKKVVRLEGNKLIAQAGYTFTKVNENTVSLKNKSVAGGDNFFSCYCKAGGDCSAVITGTSITCKAASGCSDCKLNTIIRGNIISLNSILQ